MPNHVKKLKDGTIIPCTCSTCRTQLPADQFFIPDGATASTSQTWYGDPIQELPRPVRWYVYLMYGIAFLAVITVYTYLYVL